jgi:hypothetical protein
MTGRAPAIPPPWWTRSSPLAPALTADGMGEAGVFGDPQQWRYEWERPYTRGEWLDQVPTFGGYAQLPPIKQEDLLAGIGAAIDAAGGGFTMRYTTVAVTAARAVPARR